eukprot:CAMPEP_0184656170 /NCGR_PEP_ID=MMETSP0308-20130426/15874_1 /TAXON_ID=38269 /ORGANISM="Gloeochaete witrockiana, Strain SAG 46.84" /LENGTH=179 /DNA_ID=CAMNT_0027093157 /DNA_START=130 /DNA_END=669 /DNA_ORIENTATION=-
MNVKENGEVVNRNKPSWQYIVTLIGVLIQKIKERFPIPLNEAFDAVLVISRGGMVAGCLFTEAVSIRNVLTTSVKFYAQEKTGGQLLVPEILNWPSPGTLENKRVLIIDDVWETGHTLVAVRKKVQETGASEVYVATLHFKPQSNSYPGIGPDFFAEEISGWVTYPWKPRALCEQIPCE